MKEFIDKIFIMLLSIFILIGIYSDLLKVAVIFALITTAALMSYMRLLGKKGVITNRILEYIFGILTIFFPEAVIFVPIVAYEVFIDRQIPAGVIMAAGFIRTSMEMALAEKIIFLVIIGLAVFMAYRTQKLGKLLNENRKVRDEGEIKNEKLNERNRKLMAEQDKSIFTAQLAERNRIAREIHDNVGHMLSRSLLQVGAMMVTHKGEPVADELKSLRETLDTAMNNIRESVHDIRDEAIDLEAAIKEMTQPLNDKFHLSVEFDADLENIDKDVKYALINIVKEAVSNIMKYSKNEYVTIRFDEHPSMYQLIIHDFGTTNKDGVNDQQVSESKTDTKTWCINNNGMGLENIRTRAEQLGGQANFSNDNGFRVFVRIPKKLN
ncbi:MAG: GHKL domain-containing protein [Lachnospiraceae bacterium]|nr:GHKL domain-containing protein [Lachnospiraceae bacterium]